jgi:hypothetical protein
MARSWPVDRKWWDDLLKPMAPDMMVGATQAHPGVFPEGFGISRRTEPRNEYLGLVTTWPEPETFVLGLNYYDNADQCDNEDMYKLDLDTFELTPRMGRSFVKEYPQYGEHHRASKAYLRKVAKR